MIMSFFTHAYWEHAFFVLMVTDAFILADTYRPL